MGSAALGMGQLEDVKRAFYVTQMPYTRPFHLHVLGVGALRRILPYICFSQSGLYEGIDISELEMPEQAMFAEQLDTAYNEYLDKVNMLKQEFDVVNNYRRFDPVKMTDIVSEQI